MTVTALPLVEPVDAMTVYGQVEVAIREELDKGSFPGSAAAPADRALLNGRHTRQRGVGVNDIGRAGIVRTPAGGRTNGGRLIEGVAGETVAQHDRTDIGTDTIREGWGCADAEKGAYPMIVGADVHDVAFPIDPEDAPTRSVCRWVTHSFVISIPTIRRRVSFCFGQILSNMANKDYSLVCNGYYATTNQQDNPRCRRQGWCR
jgi:hypothetical protein